MNSKGIILLGHFGAGNLGNECTLQAVIERTLRRWPQASLLCACTDPVDVESRHHITAFYWRLPESRQNGVMIDPRQPNVHTRIFRRIFRELKHLPTCLRLLRQSDMLFVCGTGVVCDYSTGPTGWPYDLFKWSALAALCRVRVLFLGIGVGPIRHPLSRWLIKRSLGFAVFRSYRDEASREYMKRIGFRTERDTVCPDLVFGLSRRVLRSNGGRARQRPVIGVGLKDYDAPSGLGETNTYQDYLAIMAALVCWLWDQGYDVRLLIGDFHYDIRTTEDVIGAIKERFLEEGRVVAEPALTVEEIVRQLDETDLVISPRFHNLVLALMLNKPVIALSDHPKLDSLMGGLGLADYNLPLGRLDVDRLIKLFVQLQNNADVLKAHIRDKSEQYRKALDELYASAFAKAERPASGAIAGDAGLSGN